MKSLTDSQYTIVEETFDTVYAYWRNPNHNLRWPCIFITPLWLKVWWDCFGGGKEPSLLAIRCKDRLMGIAPLMVKNHKAFLMGDPDVCDYLDFIVSPGNEARFFDMLMAYLEARSIYSLDLGPVRKDSIAYVHAMAIAGQKKYPVHCRHEDVSYEMALPKSWDAYLQDLSGKQRHEIRRKFRRLNESSRVDFHLAEDRSAIKNAVNVFLDLFKKNRSDKAAFMTDRMTDFFRSLADAMEASQMLRLFLLKLDNVYAAAVFGIDDGSTLSLYNNSYDNQFQSLSVGVISKALTIKYAIENGRKRYDFLKGAESYKHHMGGKPVPLYRCRIEFNRDRT